MQIEEMAAAVAAMVNDSRFDTLVEEVYLPMAKDAVVSRLWPFDEEKTFEDVPERFRTQTCQIAAYLLDRSGAEGEIRHVENGTTREWASANIPEAMFVGMVPFGGVLL